MEEKKERIYWVDLAKIIAMICIVGAHTIIYSKHLQGLNNYLNSFHVPFFFLISGITFHTNKYDNYKAFFKSKFKTIILPYFIFAILFLVPYIIMGSSVSDELNKNANEIGIKQVVGIFYGNANNDFLKQNTPLWFLPCLFIVENIFYWVEKAKNKYKYVIVMLISIIVGALDYYFLKIRLPWGIDVAIVMLFFFSIGKIIDKRNFEFKIKKWLKYVMAIVLIGVGYYIQTFNTSIGYINNNYGNYLIFIIAAVFSVIGYMVLIKQLPTSKMMQYAGMRTLPILIFHKLPILIFQTKLGKITILLKNSNFLIEGILTIGIIIIAIIFALIVDKLINKYCPILLGKNKKREKVINEE